MNVETFKYDNRIVRAFAIATVVWGIVGMLVGLLAAVQLFFPDANLNFQFITFGRIRPLHTNAVIFAFVGNGMFMRHLLFAATAVQGAHVQRFFELVQFLGLADSSLSPPRSRCRSVSRPARNTRNSNGRSRSPSPSCGWHLR